jgi:hypothetical protein
MTGSTLPVPAANPAIFLISPMKSHSHWNKSSDAYNNTFHDKDNHKHK